MSPVTAVRPSPVGFPAFALSVEALIVAFYIYLVFRKAVGVTFHKMDTELDLPRSPKLK